MYMQIGHAVHEGWIDVHEGKVGQDALHDGRAGCTS